MPYRVSLLRRTGRWGPRRVSSKAGARRQVDDLLPCLGVVRMRLHIPINRYLVLDYTKHTKIPSAGSIDDAEELNPDQLGLRKSSNYR